MGRRDFLRGLAFAPSAALQSFANDSPAESARRLRVFVLEHGSGWDWNAVTRILIQANANAIRCSVGLHGEGGGWVTMYPSKHLPPHPRLGRKDELGDAIRACKPHGIGVFPYNSLTGYLNPAVAAVHPGWQRLNPLGYSRPTVCFNNLEAVDTYVSACREIAGGYEVIGMYFDGPNLKEGNYCCCPHCQKVARDLFGEEMSADRAAAAAPEWRRRQLAVQAHGIAGIMRAIRAGIRSVREIPVLMNVSHPLEYLEHHSAVPHTDGALMAEHSRGNRSALAGALMKVKAGRAFRKAAWCYCPPGPHESEDLVTHENAETKLFGRLWLMHGGTPIIETLKAYLHDPSNLPAVRELFDHEQRHGALYWDYEPVPFLGLVFSRQNGVWRSAADPSARLGHWTSAGFEGAFLALSDARLQFNMLLDDSLTGAGLGPYKAIVLANAACLSDAQADAIRRYVNAGGGLVATMETSLADEHGRKRKDFALGDLFHASWRGVRGDAGYVRIRGAHPLAEGIAAGKPVFCPGAHLEVEPLGDAHIAATVLRPKDRGTPRAETGHEDAGPAVVAGGHGQGRIVYFAAPLDEVYRERGFNTVRRLFHNAVRWVARAAPPVTVEGPGGVYVNLTANATRRAVHLLNYTGFISEQPARKVEWIAPLHDLRVRVRDPEAMEPVRASLLTTGKEIGFDRAGGETVFVLARLEEHECIQIEYRRG